jgi:hypothetical protein
MKNFSMVERNLRKSQTNIKEDLKDGESDSLLQTEPSFFDDHRNKIECQPPPGEEIRFKEAHPDPSSEKKYRLHPLKLKFTPLGGDKKNFLVNINLNKSMNFDLMKSKDQNFSQNNSNENIFNNSSFKFIPKTNNTYNEKKLFATKTRNRNLSENFDPSFYNNIMNTQHNVTTNQFNHTQITHVTTEQIHQFGVPGKLSGTGTTYNNPNYSFEQSLIMNGKEKEKNRKKEDNKENTKKIDLNLIKKYNKKITPSFANTNTPENLNSSVDFGNLMERRSSSHIKKSKFQPNITFNNENVISEKIKEEKVDKTEIQKLKIDKETNLKKLKLDNANLKLEIHRENEISICNNIVNKNEFASKEKNLKSENKIRSPSYLHINNDNKNMKEAKDSSPHLKTKTISFDKKTINYTNNLLTDTQEASTITRINTNTKEKEETFNFNPNMDCIEDLHFQFVKFCIKSKKIIKYQESAMRTCKDDFNTVIPVEEVDLI